MEEKLEEARRFIFIWFKKPFNRVENQE